MLKKDCVLFIFLFIEVYAFKLTPKQTTEDKYFTICIYIPLLYIRQGQGQFIILRVILSFSHDQNFYAFSIFF